MLFNSLEFALFFPLVCALYFALPAKARLPFLLIASCVFYMAFIPIYILILFVTILIDYVAGIYIERKHGPARKIMLIVSIISTCVVLFVFKYYNFFVDNFIWSAHHLGWNVAPSTAKIILPIGLSFHTFQSLSYVVEVYRGNQPAEYDFVNYATYVMFFPQLVAGPIERPQNLLHQFRETHNFDYDRIVSGLQRMALGFFKKIVVADRLALYVNDVYGAPREHNGLQLTLASVFFAYQIYCDFSGYSDIAIGTARVLGFTLMENFDTPYYSRSIAEFWHRWHISLSTWFRDYLYIPMGGSRVSKPRWYFNILVTFCISGLWHGANWTYVVWGLLNGFYILFGHLTAALRQRLFTAIGLTEDNLVRKAIRIATTFLLTCIGWVVFRARNVADAGYVLTHFWRDWDFANIKTEQFLLRHLPVAVGAILCLELIQLVDGKLITWAARLPLAPRWGLSISFVLIVILFGVFRNANFIYFQF